MNVLKFLPSVSIYVLMSIKTTSPHEGSLWPERIGSSGTQLFLCLVETFGAWR